MKFCKDPLCVDGWIRCDEGGIAKIRCSSCLAEGKKRKFGEALLAIRRGWRWSEPHGCYIRISLSDLGDLPCFLIELATPGHMRKNVNSFSLEWWHDAVILERCSILESIRLNERMVEGYELLVVDENGVLVSPEKREKIIPTKEKS